MLFPIPIRTEYEPTPISRVRRHPDVLNSSWFLNVSKGDNTLWLDDYGWRNFPASSQVTSGIGTRSFGCHAALSFCTGGVLRADRARSRVGEPREVSQVHAETIE